MNSKKFFSNLVKGISKKESMFNLGFKNEQNFDQYIVSCSKILNLFGLVLRYDISTDKLYLLAESESPPEDITQAELATLGVILQLSNLQNKVYIDDIAEMRNKTQQTIIKNLKVLEKRDYLLLNKDKSVSILPKTNLRLKLKKI